MYLHKPVSMKSLSLSNFFVRGMAGVSKAQILHMLQESPALVQDFQCVQPKPEMGTYVLLCFSKGNPKGGVRSNDLLTLGFRCSDCMHTQKSSQSLAARLVSSCLHAVKYVPKYPHHKGVQDLMGFLCTSVLPQSECDAELMELKRRCLTMVQRDLRHSILSAGPTATAAGSGTAGKLSAAWYHPKASVQDAALVMQHTYTHPLNKHAAVMTNLLDEWRLAVPRLVEIGYLELLPSCMLDCMHRGLNLINKNKMTSITREEEIVAAQDHLLCMQTYTAPKERRGARAKLLVMEEDSNLQAHYAHPDQVLLAPKRQRVTDTRIAASFMHLLLQAMHLPSTQNPFATSTFQLSYIDNYDYVRVNQTMSFHWCTLRLPGRMNRPLHAGLWVTGQRNLDPRNANTYAVPDMI